MNNLEELLMRNVPETAENPGDFRNERGLLCCGKCREPKESLIRFSDSGPERRVPVGCLCAREKEKEQARELAMRERLEENERRIHLLREAGAADLPRATFRMNDGKSRSNSDTLTRYCEKFGKALEQNNGLLLYGEPGSGKTFFAECVANELKKRGYFVWMTSVRAAAAAMNGNHQSAALGAIRKADLLILDDFGGERETEYMLGQTYGIIDERYKAGKPLLVTTNLDPRKMGDTKSMALRRIYERVLAMCSPMKIEGGPRRIEVAVRKMAELKALLEE